MASRLRSNPSHLFELFAEICYSKDEEGPFIRLKYPDSFAEDDVLKQLPLFAFPCEPESHAVEHFTFTLTDIESKLRFGFCRLSAGGSSCLCFVSSLPWFDVFYKILNKMSDLLKSPEDDKGALPLLAALLEARVPAAGEACYIASQDGTKEVQFEAPHLNRLPSVISDRNLAEYCNALDYHKQIIIFASLLNERRIIFTSLKISRLSACVHACAALIYPMHWQHIYVPVLPKQLLDYCSAPMPFLIGVHAYLKDDLRKMDLGDAVIVDTDHNEVTTSHSDVEDLPHEVYSTLKKRLKVEHAGDHVARSCMRALVMLIGGYREGTKWNGKALEFNPESFLRSRPASMRPFLEKMLDLQIFRQFVDERIDLLNKSKGYHDEFENEIILWSSKASSSSKHKLMAGAKKLQKDGKDLASKVKSKSRMAVRSIKRRLHDEVKPDDGHAHGSRRPQRMDSYKQSMADELDSTAISLNAGLRLDSKRPPRPPLPHSTIENHSWMKKSVGDQATPNRRESYNKARHYNPLCFDDDDLAVSRVSINLMEDPDIQSVVKKSYSMEDITAADSSEESSSSSDASDTSGDLLNEADVVLLRDDVNSSPSSAPVAPPRRSRGQRRPVPDSLADHTDASSIHSSDSGSGYGSSTAHHPSGPGALPDFIGVLADSTSSVTSTSSTTLTQAHVPCDTMAATSIGEGASHGVQTLCGGSAGPQPNGIVSGAAPATAASNGERLQPASGDADAGKAVAPVRRAAPRIEQLQRELIDRVQHPGAPAKRPVTAPAVARDGSPDVAGGDSSAKGQELLRAVVSSSASSSASLLQPRSLADVSPRKDAIKRQTIFGDPRQLVLLPPAEEDEETVALSPTSSSLPAAAAALPPLQLQPLSSMEPPAAHAAMAASGRAQATSALAVDSGQLHEDLVGLHLGPPLPTPPAAVVPASTFPSGTPVAARPNYFVSLPPTQPGSPYLAGMPLPRMGVAGHAVRQPPSSMAQQPAAAGSPWLPTPAAAAAGSHSSGRGGSAATGSVRAVQPGDRIVGIQPPPLLTRPGSAAVAATPAGRFGQPHEFPLHSPDPLGRTAELSPGSPLRPKSMFPGAKPQAASAAATADPFADLVNLKSHLGAAAAPAAPL